MNPIVRTFDGTMSAELVWTTLAAGHVDPSVSEAAEVYALVDAAQHDDLFQFLAEAEPDFHPLFQGASLESLFAVGPVLVRCPAGSAIWPWLTKAARLSAGLVFIHSAVPQAKLTGHLQTLVNVVTEDDRELFFRWYDPRVLPSYLATCTQSELWRFFGPLALITVLAPEGGRLLVFDREQIGGDPACLEDLAPAWRTRLFVRKDQLAAFGQDARHHFIQRMKDHLTHRFGDDATVDLEVMIHQGMDFAAMYGLRKAYDVQRYLEYMLVLGPDFDLDPSSAWAGKILFRTELTGTQKMNAIDSHGLSRNWR